MLLLCLALDATMMWLASQNKVVSYIVQVDKHCYVVAIKSAQEGAVADTRVVIAASRRFLVNFKNVITDMSSQPRMINYVYSYLAKNSPAETVVSQFYKGNNPFVATQDKRAYSVQFEIRSIIRSGSDDKSWQNLGKSCGRRKSRSGQYH